MIQNILNINKNLFVNLLFAFIPISFIAGNLVLNINILLFIVLSIYICRKDVLIFKFHFFDKLIILFFSYVLFVGMYNFYLEDFKNKEILIKSFSFLRYLILYFVIRILINNDKINFNLFFKFCSVSVLFVASDLIFQYHFEKDIFGFEGQGRRLGGPFGDELVAGSFLQRFSFFLFFLLLTSSFFKKNSSAINYVIFVILSLLVSFGLVLAGNRIPFIMFLITAFLIFVFNRDNRIHFFSLIVVSIVALSIMYNTNLEIKYHYGHFQNKIINLFNSFSDERLIKKKESDKFKTFNEKYYSIEFNNKSYRMSSGYVLQFYSGYHTWKQNKIFGGGVKTFKFNCPKVFYNCATHPHNYYLEILSDLGIIGFLIISLMGIYLIFKSFLIRNSIISPFIFLLISELFPLKTTGSFFTTSNATYIFLILAIIAGFSFKKN